MKIARWMFAFLTLAAVLVWAQRDRGVAPPRELPTWEYLHLQPQEIGVGEYQQVSWYQVTALGAQGWELISVTPWVLRNDLHKPQKEGESRLVTQNYVAYYFKRQRPEQR
ncbi:hypothetical protein [uncultured Paludibaculum sp.]|uniref:hypothetical protein n=1 Tax=uncultured Paludibaculum sp. TaxID=1765020 RepID=UPI002AAB96A1|nr:hypothetical protein [uncultured Paludibaculum sp.]